MRFPEASLPIPAFVNLPLDEMEEVELLILGGNLEVPKFMVASANKSHRIHVWYIYLHLVDFYCKYRSGKYI